MYKSFRKKGSTMKKVILGFSIVFIMAGCNGEEGKDQPFKKEEQIYTTESPNPIKKEPSSPKEKKLKVTVEGFTEIRTGTLQESDLGYSLYILDGFSLEQEEPGRDLLFYENDDSFFVRISKLDSEIHYDEIKKNLLNSSKNVIEENPETLAEASFKDAEFYLIDADNYISIIAKEFDGQNYLFSIHMPLKEAAEGVGPNIWAMLSTFVIQ